MSKKLLIDARQDDETRVVVLNEGQLEDFDHEISHRKPLKGNIYLARVTRVEASLQAAFVEYGGNKQGFLAFSEIHPDYYRIPVEDREKILAEADNKTTAETDEESITSEQENPQDETNEENDTNEEQQEATPNDELDDDASALQKRRRQHFKIASRYKIQEVISNRQIILIQVVKEERGNKGAAVTTYLSLAGRYCVLMPNTYHNGGVSRKIANQADRKKLKTIVGNLDIPKGMAIIVRTAGSKRTKTEISRDFNYLMRQWNEIRDLTMESTAPALIHEEGDLIKRVVRDYYSADVNEILVEGKGAHKIARGHMKNLMPSHVKKVKLYEDETMPLFQQHRVEEMLSSIHEPQTMLPSGGYLIINQTEALVAIDVNSGRSTSARHIEDTALKTNLEAAEKIAEQLKQRDLSGLIVIDFIDMESNRNQRSVERKLKDALFSDRARIQVGNISQFGLLEISRQRLRSSIAEAISTPCPHCEGTGRIRSLESSAMQALRNIETEAIAYKDRKNPNDRLTVYMNAEIALYILNRLRSMLIAIEEQCNITVVLEQDNSLMGAQIRFPEKSNKGSGQGGNKEKKNRRRKGAKDQQNIQQDDQKNNKQTGKKATQNDANNIPAEETENVDLDENKESPPDQDSGKKKRKPRAKQNSYLRNNRRGSKDSKGKSEQNADNDQDTSHATDTTVLDASGSETPTDSSHQDTPVLDASGSDTPTDSSPQDTPILDTSGSDTLTDSSPQDTPVLDASGSDTPSDPSPQDAPVSVASGSDDTPPHLDTAQSDAPAPDASAPKATKAKKGGRNSSVAINVVEVDEAKTKRKSKKKGWWQ